MKRLFVLILFVFVAGNANSQPSSGGGSVIIPAPGGDISSVWSTASGDVTSLTAGAGDTLNASGADSSIPFVTATDCSSYTTDGMACYDTDDDRLFVGDGTTAVDVGANPTGDITDVYNCSTGDCAAITMASGDSLNAGDGIIEIPNSTTLPGTCNVGDIYMDTDATTGQRLYLCESANTWALQGDGGGAGAGDNITEGTTSAEVIDTGVDGRLVITTEGAEAMRVDASGNVGIGTTVIPQLLTVAGTVQAEGFTTSVSGDPVISFDDDADATNEFTMGVDASDSSKFKIGTTAIDASTILTITAAGDVGINTTSASTTNLHVHGDTSNSQYVLTVSNNTDSGDLAAFKNDLGNNIFTINQNPTGEGINVINDETGTEVWEFNATQITGTGDVDIIVGLGGTFNNDSTNGDVYAQGNIEADGDVFGVILTECVYLEDPTASDDLNSVWTTNGFAATITKMWCESDQTVNMDLQVDDGTPADVNGTDLVCDSTPAEDETLSGDTTMADGDRLDLAITSVSGTPTWVSMCWTYKK